MSVNRKRNPYTLGGFAQQEFTKRRASCTSLKEPEEFRDPFEHDPFKVQSYNFRYAEPPGYHLQTPFCVQPLLNRSSEMQQPNFRDSRRRKFIQASNYNTHNPMHTDYYQSNLTNGSYSSASYTSPANYFQRPYNYIGAASPESDTGYVSSNNVLYRNPTLPYNTATTTSYNHNNSALPSSSNFSAAQRSATPNRSNQLKNKRSSVSLCEIQIKINRSEHTLSPDNVVINIATDKNGTITASPYKSERLTINTIPFKSAALGQQQSKSSFTGGRATQRRQSTQSVQRRRCCSTSSESSTDIDTPLKRSQERVPQFIALQTMNKKVQEEKQAPTRAPVKQTISLLAPPWVLGTKSSKEQQRPLQRRISNQTIMDNLDTQSNKSKLKLGPKSSSTTLSPNTSISSQQSIKASVSCINKNFNGNRPRASSAVRTTKTSDQNPLRVNINLYRDKKLGLRV